MKRGPLGLHVVNELSDFFSVVCWSVTRKKASVVLDLLVEFAHLSHIAFFVRAEPVLFA